MFVRFDGELYRPVWGALREDLVDKSALPPLDGQVLENVPPYGTLAPEVFEISGVADNALIAGRITSETRGITARDSAPLCFTGDRVFIFTAVDTEVLPPPFSYPTRTPPSDGGPTATPPPTPGGYAGTPLKLTPERLIEAGWPNIFWEVMLISYGDRWHAYTADYYLDGPSPATAIRSDQLEEIELIEFEHVPAPEIPEEFAQIFAPATVTDYVRVYRPAGAPDSGVIVVDPCPVASGQAEYEVYQKVATND
jgi:hypothetical protein